MSTDPKLEDMSLEQSQRLLEIINDEEFERLLTDFYAAVDTSDGEPVIAIAKWILAHKANAWDEGVGATHRSPLTLFAIKQVNPYRTERDHVAEADAVRKQRQG